MLFVRTGCLLGLALVLATLCNIERTDVHVRITETLDKLASNLQDGLQGRMQQEVKNTTYHTCMHTHMRGWTTTVRLWIVCLFTLDDFPQSDSRQLFLQLFKSGGKQSSSQRQPEYLNI